MQPPLFLAFVSSSFPPSLLSHSLTLAPNPPSSPFQVILTVSITEDDDHSLSLSLSDTSLLTLRMGSGPVDRGVLRTSRNVVDQDEYEWTLLEKKVGRRWQMEGMQCRAKTGGQCRDRNRARASGIGKALLGGGGDQGGQAGRLLLARGTGGTESAETLANLPRSLRGPLSPFIPPPSPSVIFSLSQSLPVFHLSFASLTPPPPITFLSSCSSYPPPICSLLFIIIAFSAAPQER
jgi:hypothetical protein